jgi:serine/threonine protein kinase
MAAAEAHKPFDSRQGDTSTSPTSARFVEIRELFEAALQVDLDARPAWLRHACKDDSQLCAAVEELLRADRLADEGDLMFALTVTKDEAALPRMEGRRIGHYQIIREIGRGGMGAVYLARRSDDVFSKEIAIKVLRPERSYPELLRRFRQERDIIARLDHPNIARLLDGGTTDEGLPYSVMEYVEGQPIDTYCDTHRLSIEQRLKLFRTVCLSVQYAHQNLVVHRDLKPSNILVTANGTVKLLDFGIAKLMEGDLQQTFTATSGLRLMTPAYASPEQTRGEPINTSSDVYSLGVILYQLITGRWPYRTKGRLLHEVAQAICEQDPAPPSEIVLQGLDDTGAIETTEGETAEHLCEIRGGKPSKLHRRLAGELDNIVLMALRKEPQRRYSSVEQLSEDVNRHLSGLPVLAQHDTVGYRAGKFVKRHRAGVAAAALITLSMSAAIVATGYQVRVARFQWERAEREAASAKEQLHIAQERTREANEKDREAALEREKAARRAQQTQAITAALLRLNAGSADSAGARNSRSAVYTAEQILSQLLSEGYTNPALRQDLAMARELNKKYAADKSVPQIVPVKPKGPANLGFEEVK